MYVLQSMYSKNFFLQFLYYYQVHESEFGYPIFHVLDKQIYILADHNLHIYRETLFIQHGFRYVPILLLANLRVLKLFSLFTDDESISVLLHVSSHYERQNQSSK
jgi:hypothetical protein